MGLFMAAVRLVTALIRLSAVMYCLVFSIGCMALQIALQLWQNPSK